MRAARIYGFGGPEALVVEEMPTPQPADHEALVRVHAAGVNPVDLKTRSGVFSPVGEQLLPLTLGQDVSGTVELCGRSVRSLALGQPVYAYLPPTRGGYAEYVLIRESEASTKPRNLDHRGAAAVPLAATTAWQGLFDHGKLAKGERVLVHGGAGGVGHFAVQLAKLQGAEVLATADGRDLDLLRELGVDRAIDYRAERFEDVAHDVDLVFDVIGGETLERSLDVLRPGGRLISTVAEAPEGAAEAHGVEASRFMAHPRAAILAELTRLIDDGMIRVVLDRVFSLDEAAEAHRYLAGRHGPGKVVLDVELQPRDQNAVMAERRETAGQFGVVPTGN